MENQRMIAYCGLICTDCPAYLATKENDVGKAKQTAKQWSLAYNVQVKVEDVWCDGCLVEGKKCAHCGRCEIRACAIEQRVENCGLCAEYPCERIEAFFKVAPAAPKTLDSLRNG
ncbi:MAG: DUF3795 domain-containing protein [Deltaproteobacteria bacterium]|nr:DUF3795 domain-containing protein [Deltaproteobacteria bacterium]